MNYLFLQKEILESIRRRCDMATKEPWISYVEGRDHTSGDSVIIRCDGKEKDLYLIGGTIEDQDFIANARQDIPLLLNEIEMLHTFIEKLLDESNASDGTAKLPVNKAHKK